MNDPSAQTVTIARQIAAVQAAYRDRVFVSREAIDAAAVVETLRTHAALRESHERLRAALARILPWHDSHPAEATDNPLINECRAALEAAPEAPMNDAVSYTHLT